MHTIQIGTPMPHAEIVSTLYDLGQHALEVTEEGDILIAEHAARETPLKETVQLDQDETYHLFLVLQAWFTKNENEGNAQHNDLLPKGDASCS